MNDNNITNEEIDALKRMIADDNTLPFYRSAKWQKVRKEIIRRDHAECQHCAAKGLVTTKKQLEKRGRYPKLDVNHILPIKTHPHLAYAHHNLELLCVDCHNKADGKKWYVASERAKNAQKKKELANELYAEKW